jgi:hypothetical protein
VNFFVLALILTNSSFPDSVGVALWCSYDIEDLLNEVLIPGLCMLSYCFCKDKHLFDKLGTKYVTTFQEQKS